MKFTDLTPKMILLLKELEKKNLTRREQQIYSLPSIQIVGYFLRKEGLIAYHTNSNREIVMELTEKGRKLVKIIKELEELNAESPILN